MSYQLIQGDALGVLRGLAANSVDAMVADPPAGINFMQKDFDSDRGGRTQWVAWLAAIMAEALRVTKPGGHALVWALPRTSHWTALALEDAGWEIREKVYHCFGSGFPKSKRVNQDLAFCQCAAEKRNASSKDHEPQQEAHTDKAIALDGDAPLLQDALHSMNKSLGSQGDYQQGYGSYDVPVQMVPEDGQASPRPLGYVQAHNHSVAPSDGRHGESLHSPYPAQRIDHPASLDYSHRERVQTESDSDTQATYKGLSRQTGSDGVSQVPRTLNKDESLLALDVSPVSNYSIGLPRCLICGKPNADGLGSALKPAVEEWVLCRKPLAASSIAAQVLATGTGGINVGACRVGFADTDAKRLSSPMAYGSGRRNGLINGEGGFSDSEVSIPQGRFPANLVLSHASGCVRVGTKRVKGTNPMGRPSIGQPYGGNLYEHGLDTRNGGGYADADGLEAVDEFVCEPHCPVRLLGEQGGERVSSWRKAQPDRAYPNAIFPQPAKDRGPRGHGDSGSVARFFPNFEVDHFSPDGELDVPFYYAAKSSRAERNAGLDGMPVKIAPSTVERHKLNYTKGDGEPVERIPRANTHPTVKSQALMRWLVTLITPPGGTVLDPFAGSGSTGVAAISLGFNFIGVEREAEYIPIAEARLAWAAAQAEKSNQQLRMAL